MMYLISVLCPILSVLLYINDPALPNPQAVAANSWVSNAREPKSTQSRTISQWPVAPNSHYPCIKYGLKKLFSLICCSLYNKIWISKYKDIPRLMLHPGGSHWGTFWMTASTACPAAIRVSQAGLWRYVVMRDNRWCNSCGCSRCTSPSWRAAARRVTPDEPVSSSTNKRSNLWVSNK